MTRTDDTAATAADAPGQWPSVRRGSRRLPVLLGVIAVVVAVAIVVAVRYRPDDSSVRRTSEQRVAPTFAIPELRDQPSTVDLQDFRDRPVVLNFWASWCVPCRREMPALETVHRGAGDWVAFVGVNHQDSRDDALELLRETAVGYRSGIDPQGRVAQTYALDGMPTTVFISADGRILASRTGARCGHQATARHRSGHTRHRSHSPKTASLNIAAASACMPGRTCW